MKLFLCVMGVATALTFSPMASAYTCPANTWCFGPTNGMTATTGTDAFVNQGATGASFSSATFGAINIFAEQVTGAATNGTNGGTIVGTIATEFGAPTLGTGADALFQVSDSPNNEGVGIAPYNPSEGASYAGPGNTNPTFANQNGLDDAVPENSNPGTTYGNILEIELGSNIAKGTSLAFLLEAGIGAGSDTVDYYAVDSTSTSPVNPSTMGTRLGTTSVGAIQTDPSPATPQFSITKNTSGIEWIAIEADCHYILLDTITGTAGTVPEPRFYGILLAALLGLAGIVYKRRAAQVNA
jgi:hypothetical protein